MAVVTPDTITRSHMGAFTLTILDLPNTADDADTVTPGIQGIVSVMVCQADTAGTQAATGAGASFSGTTITLHIGEDNSAMTIWVLSKS